MLEHEVSHYRLALQSLDAPFRLAKLVKRRHEPATKSIINPLSEGILCLLF